jgi:predicted PurR-regulated permease PerM
LAASDARAIPTYAPSDTSSGTSNAPLSRVTSPPAGDSSDFGRRALRAATIAILLALGAVFLVLEGRILALLLAGVLLALAFRAASSALASRLHIPYGVALGGLAVLVVVALAVGAYALGAGLAEQAGALGNQLVVAWHSLLEALHGKPGLAPIADRLEQGGVPGGDHTATVAAGAGGVLQAGATMVVVFFLGVYGAAQPDAYPGSALLLVPRRHRGRVKLALHHAAEELTRWLAGRLVAMTIVGLLVTGMLLLMRIPLAWLLGALAGLLTFIEYLGAYASAAPAMLLAFTRGPINAVWVGVLFTAIHMLEGYVLTPLLVRRAVRFPPGYTLSAQVVLGAIYGVAGLTFATPTLVISAVLVKQLYIDRRDRVLRRGARHAPPRKESNDEHSQERSSAHAE